MEKANSTLIYIFNIHCLLLREKEKSWKGGSWNFPMRLEKHWFLLAAQPAYPLGPDFFRCQESKKDLSQKKIPRGKKNNSPVVLYIHKTFLNLFSIDCSQWGEDTHLSKLVLLLQPPLPGLGSALHQLASPVSHCQVQFRSATYYFRGP